MAYKELHFQSEARERLLRGARALTDAVRITLGPKSKCVLIQKSFGVPVVCNDGVTIAREVELKDPCENLGAQMIRQAAERTGDAVGDGNQHRHDSRLRNLCRGRSQRGCRCERHRSEARYRPRNQDRRRVFAWFIEGGTEPPGEGTSQTEGKGAEAVSVNELAIRATRGRQVAC